MIDGLKPYPAMKDSGVPWLGEVPDGWNVLRGRHLFEIRKRIVGELGHPVLSVTQVGLRVKDVHTGEGQVSQDYSKYQIVKPGEFVMNSMDLLTGGVGIADSHGVTSPDYRAFAIRHESQYRDRYALYVFRMLYANRGFYAWGQGSAQLGRWRLPRKRFNEFPFPVPPLAEQAAIVRFLDHADRRIGRYIRAKQKLSKLLEEQKQAIIQRAVTRGLDPNVRLKPSGVEWLGDVPEHWEVSRLGRQIIDGPRNGISPPVIENGSVESFSISAVRDGIIVVNDRDKKYVSGDRSRLAREYNLLAGDVLLVRGNGNIRLVGKAGVVEEDMPGRVYPDLLMRLRVGPSCTPHFLVALLNTQVGRDQIETAARTAVGTFKLNNQQVRQLWFAWPPVPEQHQILTWLSSLPGLRGAIQRPREEVRLLEEYRTRLIADVVTGKLDVREAAARLPDEVDESEPLDEIGHEDDTDEPGVDDIDEAPEEVEA